MDLATLTKAEDIRSQLGLTDPRAIEAVIMNLELMKLADMEVSVEKAKTANTKKTSAEITMEILKEKYKK